MKSGLERIDQIIQLIPTLNLDVTEDVLSDDIDAISDQASVAYWDASLSHTAAIKYATRIIKQEIKELSYVAERIDEDGSEWEVSDDATSFFNLIVEEVLDRADISENDEDDDYDFDDDEESSDNAEFEDEEDE